MSVTGGALPRPTAALPRANLVALALLLPLITMLALHAGSLADSSQAPIRLDPEQARRAGVALELRAHPELPAPALEIRGGLPSGTPGSHPTVLAASPDGAHVAVAEALGQDPTTLVVAHADGGQVRVPFDGLLAATFAPDGSWLAASDGLGRLWGIDAASGEANLLAEGPFAGPLLVDADGAVLALLVPSVEAPFASSLVRVDHEALTPLLADEPLVYGMQPLAAGVLAVFAHRPGGTVLLQLGDASPEMIADLGAGAVNASASGDLALIAWEQDGDVLLRRAGTEQPTRIAGAASPRVATDGSMVLVEMPGATRAVDMAGEWLADFDDPVVLLPCRECAS